MAKRKTIRPSLFRSQDMASWNFVIFLTLAFILLVVVVASMRGVARDLRSRAGLSCPRITELPRPEACPGGAWTYTRNDVNGCPTFFCEAALE